MLLESYVYDTIYILQRNVEKSYVILLLIRIAPTFKFTVHNFILWHVINFVWQWLKGQGYTKSL